MSTEPMFRIKIEAEFESGVDTVVIKKVYKVSAETEVEAEDKAYELFWEEVKKTTPFTDDNLMTVKHSFHPILPA